MLTVVIGLASALVYGTADFLGGLASRRVSPVTVTALAAVVGFATLVPFALLVPGRVSGEAVLWGALSGLTGSLGVLLLYAALAIGPMSILSPLTAVLAAAVPGVWGLAAGDPLGPLGIAALGIALVAVVLVGFVPERGAVRPRPRGLLAAIGSGVLLGSFFILIDRSPDDSGLVPLLANRALAAVMLLGIVGIVGVVALVARARRRSAAGERWTAAWRLILACGIADAAANALILVGLRIGELSVTSVLAALYPAGTILLAAVVLRERIAPVQWIGLALALVAAGMLAL